MARPRQMALPRVARIAHPTPELALAADVENRQPCLAQPQFQLRPGRLQLGHEPTWKAR